MEPGRVPWHTAYSSCPPPRWDKVSWHRPGQKSFRIRQPVPSSTFLSLLDRRFSFLSLTWISPLYLPLFLTQERSEGVRLDYWTIKSEIIPRTSWIASGCLITRTSAPAKRRTTPVTASIRTPLFFASPREGPSSVFVLASLFFQTSLAILQRMGNWSFSSCWVRAA